MTNNEAPARVLTLDEVLTGKGGGWLEEHYLADAENPVDEVYLTECAYVKGWAVTQNGEFIAELKAETYGKKGGARIWSAMPTEEQREQTPWNR